MCSRSSKQIKALWSKFQRELNEGLPPVISSSSSAIAESLQQRPGCGLRQPRPSLPPPYRICHFVPVIAEEADPATQFTRNLDDILTVVGLERAPMERQQRQQRQRVVDKPPATKEQAVCPASSSGQEEERQRLAGIVGAAVTRSTDHQPNSSASFEKTPAVVNVVAPVTGFGSLALSRYEVS